MKYLVTDIIFDTDGEDLGLPKEMEIEIPTGLVDEEEIEEFVSDEISNITGFCHKGFSTSPLIEE